MIENWGEIVGTCCEEIWDSGSNWVVIRDYGNECSKKNWKMVDIVIIGMKSGGRLGVGAFQTNGKRSGENS